MTKHNSLATALTAASLIALTTGCASPSFKPRSASIFGEKVDTSNIGLATRAQAALAANEIDTAISLAERAVERSPRDAGFRALLGNCYLAAGRFASAEAAYKDSLTLIAAQPQLVLKLALVQIAQGKNEEARSLLAQAQAMLDPSDTGLALALAGDPHSAIAVLEPAARQMGADSRTRQNLALAHAFAGNWEQAKIVASQDVPADQLDSRLQQWMALAKPVRPSDQVAAFIGIQPAAADPGQPVRLALNPDNDVRQAAAAPVPAQPVPVYEPVAVAAAEPMPAPEPTAMAAVEPLPTSEVLPSVEPIALAGPIAPPQVPVITEAPISPIRQARPALSPAAARLSDGIPALRKAAAPQPRKGRSNAVVQLGAYSSRGNVGLGWTKVSRKYGALKGYTPVTARYVGAKGTFYRLSVKGFDSDREAMALCESLKKAGGSCFVRAVSGDAPVQLASRG